ncbi:MAG: hypothetical protein HGB19_00850 [Chlorobiales bacterium]|jgi:hypothetical protein|nr:hypothetical protein [Chlorobiales bacterium]
MMHSSKKRLLLFLIFVLTATSSFAQNHPTPLPPFRQGSQLFGISTGIGPFNGAPVMLGTHWEIGLTNRIMYGYFGIDLLGGLYLKKGDIMAGVGVDLNYHYDLRYQDLDFYTGLSAMTPFSSSNEARFGVHLGCRYFIHRIAAVSARVGYGFTILSIGMDYRIN